MNSSNYIGEHQKIKVKDLTHMKGPSMHWNHADITWLSQLGDDRWVLVYDSLTIEGDFSLDTESMPEPDCYGIIVKGDLHVNGNIQNFCTDTGIKLYVVGETTAINLIAGGSSMILGEVKIENFTVGHYNGGYLHIESLSTRAMLNFDHDTAINDTGNIDILICNESKVAENAKLVIEPSELAKFWFSNNVFMEYITEEIDEDEDEDAENFYYLEDEAFTHHIKNGQENILFKHIKKYVEEGSPQIDIDLPQADENSIQYRWLSGRLVGVTIRSLKGMELFSKAIARGKLQSLRNLKLKGFKIDEIPDTFKHLNQLRKFTINRCRLSVIPEWIGKLIGLKILDLRKNKVSELPNSLQHLTELVELLLSQNRLTEIPDCLGNLSKLETITLDRNKISIVSDSIKNLKMITKLNFSSNKLTSIPNGVCEIHRLIELDLSNNALEKVPESIGNLNRLTSLDCSHNNLTEVPSDIGDLENLLELDFGYNFLLVLPGSMAKLKNLKEMRLHNNQLTEIPECIKGLESLFKLYLDFNNIVEFPEWFVMIKSIGLLGIKGNEFVTLPEVIIRRYLLRDEETHNREELGKFNSGVS